VNLIQPETYYLRDLHGKEIAGCFYKEELTLVHDPNTYLIDEIVERRGDQVLVKYLGFDDEHNEWKNISDLQ
jgi:hypothetical protein